MFRINEIVDEIEDMLYDGYTVNEVVTQLKVPFEWVEEVKTRMFQEANQDFFVTQEVAEEDNLSILEEYNDY